MSSIEGSQTSLAFIHHFSRFNTMRTVMILAVGMLLLLATVLFGRLFVPYYSNAMIWTLGFFLSLWLLATGFKLWVGVPHAEILARLAA
ncbi:hypothetical protein [Iodobacter ciconiae]|uniref:hypothetical protein n=1 Tax=Iodobacter ciconiae TaxID=2496266 RepID=UPI0013DEE487|nr:hypothetical protein [Iodobacter ciconiae]